MKPGRATTLLLAVVLCGVLPGCGIRPTGVVDAGEPARGPIPEATEDTGNTGDTGETGDNGADQAAKPGAEVYLVTGDTVEPVFRPDVPSGDPDAALRVLLQGPTQDELKSGYSTEIPPNLAALQLGRRGLNTVTVILSLDPNQLSSLAILQISCTIAYTVPSDSLITLRSPNGEALDTKPCPDQSLIIRTPVPQQSPRVGG